MLISSNLWQKCIAVFQWNIQCISLNCAVFLFIVQCISVLVLYSVCRCIVQCITRAVQLLAVTGDSIGVTGRQRAPRALLQNIRNTLQGKVQ